MSRRHQGGRTHRSGGHGRPSAAPLAAPSPDSQRYRPEAIEPARVDPPGGEPLGPIADQPRVPFASPQASPVSVQAGTLGPPSELPAPALEAPSAATPFALPPGAVLAAAPGAQVSRPGLQSDGVPGPST